MNNFHFWNFHSKKIKSYPSPNAFTFVLMSLVLCLSHGCHMDVTCISDFSMWYHKVNLLSKIWHEKSDMHVTSMWHPSDKQRTRLIVGLVSERWKTPIFYYLLNNIPICITTANYSISFHKPWTSELLNQNHYLYYIRCTWLLVLLLMLPLMLL